MSSYRKTGSDPALSGRDLQVLQAIIDDYISTAEPVGSRSLSRGHALDVSAATIRNVMADLEHLGYLAKPHTSAGRVPTEKAFRFYVDTLLRVRPLPGRIRAQVDRLYGMPASESVESLLQQTGRLLHALTHHAAVVAMPRVSQGVYRNIRFVRLRENRVLAVLVTGAGLVQNRVLMLDFEVSQEELDAATRYLDALLDGRSMGDVRVCLEEELAREQAAYDQLVARALRLGQQAVAPDGGSEEPEVIIEGQTALFGEPEFEDREKMRLLLGRLEEKALLLRVLERAEGSQGIRIFIGSESELGGEDVSVVVATYGRSDATLGALGIIGPTRMDYARVVPSVEYTASQLSRVFEDV